jgi:hypothetical protein
LKKKNVYFRLCELANPIVNETNSVVILTQGEICSLPPVEPSNISCFAFIPSWTFNSALGRCQSFVYGGCGKTANLFDTQPQCEAACGTGGEAISFKWGIIMAELIPHSLPKQLLVSFFY